MDGRAERTDPDGYENPYDARGARPTPGTDGAVDVQGTVDSEASLDDVDSAFRRAQRPESVKGEIRLDGD